MGFARISGFVVILFAAAGVAGFWQGAAAPILLVGFLLLPGAALSSLVCDAASEVSGPGRLAFAASASLALLVPGVLPLFLLGAPLESATWSLAAVYAAVGAAALMFGRREISQTDTGAWWSFVVAAAVLLPAVVHYAGGTVDDWWDLAFIRGYLNSGSLTFAEPVLGTERIHPRFGWNSWLVLQSLVAQYSQVPPEALHNPWLAITASLLGLAAVDRLAVSIFGGERKVARYAALLFVPAWLWGTEALPYFLRCYQDKFVAGLILAPTMIAAAVTAFRLARVRDYAAFAIAAVATIAVHGVVFAVASLGTAIVFCGFVFERGFSIRDLSFVRNARAIARPSAILAAIIGFAGIYPLWQAATLYSRFSGQGISLATPDNPVVRAHLALGRLIGAPNPAYIVNPEAVFGVVVVVAVLGAVVAAKGRRRGDRILLCLAVLPALLIFVPYVAAAVGSFLVPWMLYRIGWLIPVAVVSGRAFEGAFEIRNVALRRVASGALVALTAVSVYPAAVERIERDMHEHPGSRESAPRGTTLEIYEALRALPGHAPVIAPVGFSNLVPGIAAKPVVALSERGTLVFSDDEANAYRRLRDRAEFFSRSATIDARESIARRYASDYAVFRRGYVTAGSDGRWFEKATAAGFLLSGAVARSPTWTANMEEIRAAIPDSWQVLVENPDFFLVRIVEGDVEHARNESTRVSAPEPSGVAQVPDWVRVLDVDAPQLRSLPGSGDELLASMAGFPSATFEVSPVPLAFGITEKLVWGRGGAIWEDGPDRVRIDIELNSFCDVTGIAVVPHVHEAMRKAFEVRVRDFGENTSIRSVAQDMEPIILAFDRQRTDRVEIEIRSLLGVPFGLADVQVFGDRASCESGWQPRVHPSWKADVPDVPRLLVLAGRYPNSQRAAVGIADARSEEAPDDARSVLRMVLDRETKGAVGWIELGLLNDQVGAERRALTLYRKAARMDSNSAWARGCLAWFALRHGQTLRSAFQAWRAMRLDPRYADAYTMLAIDSGRLGADHAADRFLARAMSLDPRRGWAFMVKSRRLAAAGKRFEAERLLRGFLSRVPDDSEARALLTSLRVRGDAWRDG